MDVSRATSIALVLACGACSIDFDRHLGSSGTDAAIDAGFDAGFDADPGLPPPVLWLPFNGWDSGSVRATTAREPRRPLFRWRPVPGATRYRIRVSESDRFTTNQVEEETDLLELTPATPLAVNDELPFLGNAIGRRYYWQVQACDAARCSEFSRANYLDVARVPSDFDGDGDSDLFVGAPNEGIGGMGRFYEGSDTGLSEPADIPPPRGTSMGRFGAAAAALDVNGDGFSELVVAAPGEDAIYLFPSQHGGLLLARATPIPVPWAGMGGPLRNMGDVNGDGFDDLAVGLPNQTVAGTNAGAVHVYYGARDKSLDGRIAVLTSPDPRTGAKFGQEIGGRGDVNGDGYTDLAVGSPFLEGPAETFAGLVQVFLGGESGLALAPAWTFEPPMGAGLYGAVSIAGDLDGNGYADLVVGAPDGGARSDAFVYLFGPTGPSTTPISLDSPVPSFETPLFGCSIASEGDLDGDGSIDLIIGAKDWSGTMRREGSAFAWRGGPWRDAQRATAAFPNPEPEPETRFGETVFTHHDFNGDGYQDLVVGARLQGSSDPGSVFVYYGSPGCIDPEAGGAIRTITAPRIRLQNPSGAAGAQFGAGIAAAWPWLGRGVARL